MLEPQQSGAQQTVNAIAALPAVISFSVNWPEIITMTAGGLAIVWYLIIIGGKIKYWVRRYKARHRHD